jgi:hypothetical protein
MLGVPGNRPGRAWAAWTVRLAAVLVWIHLAGLLRAEDPKLIAKPEAFPTLVNPQCSHCVDEALRRAAELRNDEPVLAWIRGKYNGGAIPYRFFLVPYRVISDTYGVFVFDADAGFARGFEPSLDFTFYGWHNGVMVIRHQDGTLFSALSGRGIDGPRKGERLRPVATLTSRWGDWNNAYPGTVAYHMFEKYRPLDLPSAPNDASVSSRGPLDGRLPSNEEVVGVEVESATKAWPIASWGSENRAVHDEVGGLDVVVLWQARTHTAAAFKASLEGGGTIRLHVDQEAQDPLAPFVDADSGSRFDVAGRCRKGPLEGKVLEWLPSVQCKWFAWSAEFPGTELAD